MSTTNPTTPATPVTIRNGRGREIVVSGQTLLVRDTAKGTEIAAQLDDDMRRELSQALVTGDPDSVRAARAALILLGNAIRHGDGEEVSTSRGRKILRDRLEYLEEQISGERADDLPTMLRHIGVTDTGAWI